MVLTVLMLCFIVKYEKAMFCLIYNVNLYQLLFVSVFLLKEITYIFWLNNNIGTSVTYTFLYKYEINICIFKHDFI